MSITNVTVCDNRNKDDVNQPLFRAMDRSQRIGLSTARPRILANEELVVALLLRSGSNNHGRLIVLVVGIRRVSADTTKDLIHGRSARFGGRLGNNINHALFAKLLLRLVEAGTARGDEAPLCEVHP